jgi:MFS family permease
MKPQLVYPARIVKSENGRIRYADLLKMAYLSPQKTLTQAQVQSGLRFVIWDGLMAEVMTSLTSGTFLIAMALLLGATNLQIGILSAMPLFTNLAQLASVWLVKKYNNRRAVAVYCAYLARIPLLIIAFCMIFLNLGSIDLLLFFLFFHYLFGSIAGPSWNSWMKDMVPERMLGNYFARRSSYTQLLNIALSISLALLLEYLKINYPNLQLSTYALLFLIGGLAGLIGGYLLSKAPEPQSYLTEANIISLFSEPFRNKNFRKLLSFNAAWIFGVNIATPFFTVFMMKTMGLALPYIIGLSVVSQLASVLTIRMWGIFSDRYSNKSIISIAGPLYALCIIAWCFVGIYTNFINNLLLLIAIHLLTGFATSGINLSLTNIGLKLAPKNEAIVYLSVKNIITALFSSLGPLIGGLMADFFISRSLLLSLQWKSPYFEKVFRIIQLQQWNFLFLVSAFIVLLSLQLLMSVKEVGEVSKKVVRRIMRTSIKSNLKEYFIIGNIISLHEQIRAILKPKNRGID